MIHPNDLKVMADAVSILERRRAWSVTLANPCVTCHHTKGWHSLDGPWCDWGGCSCERYLAAGPEPAWPG